MIPLSLKLQNFLSYGEDVPLLDFSQFHIACLTGDNGHGKSALLDAITYALWGHARKHQEARNPNEGLCRIGAREMRIDFDFALDGERFRVIRSWRRTKRGIANLELQVEDGDTFRTLSEGEGIAPTQERIDQLLAMNYDTFVNSAFIVQGRADEFTQKRASERKEILGQILGLGRYDQLQGMARLRHREYSQQNAGVQARLEDLDTQLLERDAQEAELRAVNERLQHLGEEIAAQEKNQATLDAKRLEHAQTQQRLDAIAREQERLAERAQQVAKELDYLCEQQRKDGDILAAAGEIERDFATHNELRAEVAQLDQLVQQRSQLDTRRGELQEQVNRARQEVQIRQEQWTATLEVLEGQLDELKALLEQEQTIAVRHAQFKATSEQDQALEQARIRHEALIHESDRLEHAVSLAEQNRESQRAALVERLEKAHADAVDSDELAERNAELQTRIDDLDTKATERDQLKEQGGTLKTQIGERRQQLAAAEDALAEERRQADSHLGIDAAECPLCGSPLDAEHRARVAAELAAREAQHSSRIQVLDSDITSLDEQLREMRTRYQALDGETAPLPQLIQELADATARHRQLRESAAEAKKLDKQVAELDQETVAPEERQRLKKIAEEIGQLGYNAADHAALRAKLAELRAVELEYTRLQDARTQADRLEAERTEAQKKRDLAASYLAESRYAQDERAELQKVETKIAALGYDEGEHQRLRRRLDDLLDSVTKFERLQNAQRRRDSTSEGLERYGAESAAIDAQLQQAARDEDALRQRAGELGDVATQLADNQTRLDKLREERDERLQRQGALETLCVRLADMATERNKLREELKGDQRQAWIYQRLDDAFGKDGIQALIIENAVPQIEKEANAILAQLTDNRIQISFELLRDLKKGGTSETLDVVIADEIGERSYHLYSGGEAFRTNFALRIALSKVLAMRSGTRLRTLFIDEGFGTQDQHGLEQLIEAIQVVSRDFDKVLVVTHLPQLKAAFPVQIEVTKHPDLGSRFEIVRHN